MANKGPAAGAKTAVKAETPDKKSKKASAKLDLATIGGLLLAAAGILGGLLLEGGKLKDVSQVTAAMIVLGGTLGAVMVTNPMPVLMRAIGKLGTVFMDAAQAPDTVIEEILTYAGKARKHGVVALEQDAAAVEDPFLRKALNLAVDGTDLQELRKMMELEIYMEEQRGEAEAKVYEAAGGYAPTIGIIGAVLGLIQVMKHLEDIKEVGNGIAVAFVATVYGVASSNLFFLPAGNKLRARLQHTMQIRELMLDGVVGIVEGLNPKLIRAKLDAYANTGAKPAQPKAKKEAGTKGAPAGQPAPAAGASA
ncbi:MAG TPA: flagellar motor protein [Bryobacteraceae bacterium]|nr:flagellar motor protein [Bryobacteraceae bacterium]